MRFEDRLARTARALMGMGIGVGAAGCDGGTDDPPTETGTAFAGVCEGEPLPVDHYLVLGWVTVPPGTGPSSTTRTGRNTVWRRPWTSS